MSVVFDFVFFCYFYTFLVILGYLSYKFSDLNPSQKRLLNIEKMVKNIELKNETEINQNKELNEKLDIILTLLKH